MPNVYLNKKISSRISNGHPWIYSNEINKIEGAPEAAEIVSVFTHDKKFVGKGYINPKSQITVRLLTREKDEIINDEFFFNKISDAWEYRKKNGYSENCRLIFGEGVGDINTDENMAGTTHLNDIMDEENENDKLKEELQQQKDKYLRLVAEFDNVKKRNARERIELIQTAGKEIITSMLDVVDDADRAEKQLQNSDDIVQIKEGIKLVFNKLRTTLQNKGLKAMESISTDFDVEKHDAITEIPAPTDELKGKVVDEIQKGYYLNDKLIRHAKVIVGK